MQVVVQAGEEEVGAGAGSRTHQESWQEPGRADLGNRGESRILPVSPVLGKAERLSVAEEVGGWSVRTAKGGHPAQDTWRASALRDEVTLLWFAEMQSTVEKSRNVLINAILENGLFYTDGSIRKNPQAQIPS